VSTEEMAAGLSPEARRISSSSTRVEACHLHVIWLVDQNGDLLGL